MMQTVAVTLTDFLCAREAEREDRDREKWMEGLEHVPSGRQEAALQAWDKLTATAFLRLNISWEQAKIHLAAGLPRRLGEPWLKHQALPHAAHPDYREEWRP